MKKFEQTRVSVRTREIISLPVGGIAGLTGNHECGAATAACPVCHTPLVAVLAVANTPTTAAPPTGSAAEKLLNEMASADESAEDIR